MAYNERHPYTKTAEDPRRLSDIEVLNSGLFDRAKAEAANIQMLNDMREQNDDGEHHWFRKGHKREGDNKALTQLTSCRNS